MISHIPLNQSPNLGDNNQADSYGLITRSDKAGQVSQPSAYLLTAPGLGEKFDEK